MKTAAPKNPTDVHGFDASRSPHGRIAACETVPSFLRRAALLSGYRTEFWVLQAAMARSAPPLEAMPAPLRLLCEVFPRLGGVDELLRSDHLLFNYWTSCASEDSRQRVRSTMIDALPGPIRPCHLPIDLEPSPHDAFHCPECDAHHLANQGFAPTLAIHVAPFVSLCPTHGAFTIEMNKRGLFACECIDRTSRQAKQRSHEFGRRTQALVQSLLPSEDRLKALRAQLQERGFLSAEGHLRWKQFIPAHLAFHSEPFADARLTLVSRDADLIQTSVANWMSGRRCLHPVIYLLAEWSLSEISSPPVAKPNVVVRRDAPSHAAVVDAIAQTNSLSSAATSLGVATTTLVTRASELGIELHLKPSKLKPEFRTLIEESFVHGVSVEAVAAEFDVSIPSVYRILRASGQLKSERARLDGVRDERDCGRWLGMVYSSPDCSLTQLRKNAPALYARLYRNKREILTAQPHERKKHKVQAVGGHWSYLQSRALLAIQASVSTTRVAPHLRLSTRRIRFLTGLSPYSLLRASAEIRGELNKARETKSRFVERRIEEACGEMGVPVIGHQRWRVLRYLGMRLSATRLNFAERKSVKKEGP